MTMTEERTRSRKIYLTTLFGSIINMRLVAFKIVAGIIGGSAAMIADAIHSLSDLVTDIVVIAFVRLSEKPQDNDHDYGHGKYETMATTIIGLALLGVGVLICYNGVRDILRAINGEQLQQPELIALIAALVSIAMKEWAYQFTIRQGRLLQSPALTANAWHHRSDALSSIGTSIGIGGAILLGSSWAVLDPIAAVIVGGMIIKTATMLSYQALGELLEKSLPEETEQEIIKLVECEPNVSCIHHLRTRRIGSRIAIEMHVRMPASTPLYIAHEHATAIEQRLRYRFGQSTHVGIHVEPIKPYPVYPQQ